MPIYEFYCVDCHRIYNFFSARVNTEKRPACPRCGRPDIDRMVSVFASPRRKGGVKGGEGAEEAGLPGDIDEARLERAMEALAGEADRIDENDPRQAVTLMRKLSDMAGLKLGSGMEEALARLERGEDPEQVEAEMGDLLEAEEPVMLAGGGRSPGGKKERPPAHDDELYTL